MFSDRFPAVSQTFVLRQITGLIDLGHHVDIYAEWPAEAGAVHPEVEQYGLLARTTYVNPRIPAPSGYWELPVWPLTGRTWIPGADRPILNAARVLKALPTLSMMLATEPRLTLQVLDEHEFGYQASSLSALYRLSILQGQNRRSSVIHAHFGLVGNHFRFARALWKAPLIVSFHGYDVSAWPREHGHDVYRRLFEVIDLGTVNSDYTRRQVEALGCPPGKLRKLPVGLDLAAFPFRPRVRVPGEPVRILTVARLVEIKGIAYAIRAVARARLKHPDLRYDVVGDGPLRAELQRLCRELGVEEVVTLHGARDGDSVRRLMAEAHLFVLPSVSVHGDQEGQGLVLQEAQACGIPVVATEHGALPEGLLPGESGFLVPERDVESLSDRITYLVDHAHLWPALGQRGREYVQARYDIRRLNTELVGLYEEAMDAAARCAQQRRSRSADLRRRCLTTRTTSRSRD
jgi:colanic acid/amylovoran biosynthesis glycosyltransferase